jgi:hypothetical protein
VVTLLVTDGLASPRILPVVERIFAVLARAGHAGREAIVAYDLLWHFTYGEVLATHHHRPDSVGHRIVRAADPEQYPGIAAVVAATPPDASHEYFAVNLQRVLDALLGS